MGRGRMGRSRVGRRGLRGWTRNELRGKLRGVRIGDEVSFRPVSSPLLLYPKFRARADLFPRSSSLSRCLSTAFSTSTSNHLLLFFLHSHIYPQRRSLDANHLSRCSLSCPRSTSLEPRSHHRQSLSIQQQPRTRRSPPPPGRTKERQQPPPSSRSRRRRRLRPFLDGRGIDTRYVQDGLHGRRREGG